MFADDGSGERTEQKNSTVLDYVLCQYVRIAVFFLGGGMVIFMLGKFSTKLVVFGLILNQYRRESYIPPRIPHTHSILGLSISSINPLRYSSVKNLKEPHSK